MWCNLLASSSRRASQYIGRRGQRMAVTAKRNQSLGLCSFSTESDDNKAGEDAIYEELFGSSMGSDTLPPPPSPRRSRQEKSASEQETPKLQLSDIPKPLWSDSLEISDERWATKMEFNDIPDWSPDFVSRVSKERVKLLPEGIPTLSDLAKLALPPPPFPHPGHGATKEYAKLRRRAHYEHIRAEVSKLAEPRIAAILSRSTWQEKQDAVDDLFEKIEFQLRDSEPILSGHPQFGAWVEQALESYLKTIKGKEGEKSEPVNNATEESSTEDAVDISPISADDDEAVPVFMDCYSAEDPADQVVPNILHPLRPHPNDGPGRMVEEWELAANDKSKRIMLRQSTRKIARALLESPSVRVLVKGKRGVGKSAAIASIVASARKSGQIVLYLPDGNRLHRHGYYIQPNPKIEGMFDLPMLSQEICQEFLTSHESDLDGMETTEEIMKEHFTELQFEAMTEYSGGNISLVDLLKAASNHVSCAAMCYTIVINSLKNQDDKPFLMVLDEFNCYFEPGCYFHMDYDDDVKDSIPYDKINLFKPALDAMALSLDDDEDIPLAVPIMPKKGGIVAGISESCAVSRKVTDALVAYAQRCETEGNADAPLVVCDVPRFSELEVDHILANMESIGIGNLRNDRGATVMNKEGVAYLRMISSSTGQNLLDTCCY